VTHDDVDDVEVLGDLADARRDRRSTDVDWFERLYQAYLTVIGSIMAVVVATTFIGTDEISDAALERVAADGHWIVAGIAALAVLAGVRSGARGGPLTLEPPFVQHVLLSPADRDVALRAPAIRMLVNGSLAGALVGGLAGVTAAERLPVPTPALIASGAAAGAATTAIALGMAMAVAGRRFTVRRASLLGLPIAIIGGVAAGRVALAAVELDVIAIAIVVLGAAVAAGLGIASVGGLSVESSLRRAGLVSSLRLAVTRQDLRAVVLVHRRLTLDRSRSRPWFPVPRVPWPVWRRDMQSMARLPAPRLARIMAWCAVIGVASWGARTGTVALIVLAAVALHGLALDTLEGLAQEVDHPTAWLSLPGDPGRLLLDHLAAPATVLVILAIPLALALREPILLVTAPATAVVGASASIVMPPFEPWTNPMAPPESIGMTMIVRVAWPLVVTGIGLAPLLAGADPFPFIALAVGFVGWWLSRRKPVTHG
jgi:hypothetical protein